MIDSHEVGPSKRRKEWLTFHSSYTDDSATDDDLAKRIICDLTSPPEFVRNQHRGRIEFLKWGNVIVVMVGFT